MSRLIERLRPKLPHPRLDGLNAEPDRRYQVCRPYELSPAVGLEGKLEPEIPLAELEEKAQGEREAFGEWLSDRG